ncbi:MAG: hypothetical protein IPN85_17910 [Flavobacteriales bacterium]|nr:hypothetical protein [Flavobacteriales bacterium]MBK9286818.1 hypothetical protein [Flavobacteriales bacterium]MBL0035306.1 hypothetical protein [Flavobacteriales bacterium]
MDALLAYALYKGLHDDTFSFGYAGAFHDEHTARLIALGEAAMEHAGAQRNARQRLAYVMVEAYQNIIRHRAPLPEGIARGCGRSMFLLRCHPEAQQVIAQNPVSKSDLVELQDALDGLSGLDAAQLKERFLNKLSNEGPRERGGAGLGLIEMARRSGQDLRHDFRGLGEEAVLFLLQVRFGAHSAIDTGIPMAAILAGTVVQEDILFFFKGPQLAGANEAIVQLAEKDLDERNDRAQERKRGLLAAIEVLERLGGPGSHGIMLMARNGDRYELIAGLPLDTKRSEAMGAKVGQVNALDERSRTALYRDLMLGRAAQEDPLMLALVDLSRAANAPVEWTYMNGAVQPFGALKVII